MVVLDANRFRRGAYRNVAKGIRRLDELLAGDFVKTRILIGALPAALALPEDVVQEAINETQRQLAEERRLRWEAEEAAYREAFKPHALVLAERRIPSPMFVVASFGIERLLRIDFDADTNPINFVRLAVANVNERLAKWGGTLPGFGQAIGLVVNYAPDWGVRFDLDGTPRETFDAAYRVGHVELLRRGRPIPGSVLPPMTA